MQHPNEKGIRSICETGKLDLTAISKKAFSQALKNKKTTGKEEVLGEEENRKTEKEEIVQSGGKNFGVFDFDYDNCMSSTDYKSHLKALQAQPPSEKKSDIEMQKIALSKALDWFLNYIVSIIKQKKYDGVYIILGSNRQSALMDDYNNTKNKNGSAFTGLMSIRDLLKEKLAAKNINIPVEINMFLMSDLFNNRAYGTTFENQLKRKGYYPNVDPSTIEPDDATIFVDSSKFTTIYTHMHLFASTNSPNDNHDFWFFDDTSYLLQVLGEIHYLYPGSIPPNTVLNIRHFDGSTPDHHPWIRHKFGLNTALFRYFNYLGYRGLPGNKIDYNFANNLHEIIKATGFENWRELDESIDTDTGNKILYKPENKLLFQKFLNDRITELENPNMEVSHESKAISPISEADFAQIRNKVQAYIYKKVNRVLDEGKNSFQVDTSNETGDIIYTLKTDPTNIFEREKVKLIYCYQAYLNSLIENKEARGNLHSHVARLTADVAVIMNEPRMKQMALSVDKDSTKAKISAFFAEKSDETNNIDLLLTSIQSILNKEPQLVQGMTATK